MKTICVLGASAAVALAAPAGARIVVEDFVDASGTAPAFDAFFDYDFGGTRDFISGDAHNLLVGSLLLTPDRMVVTFNTDPGERVLSATVVSQELRAPGQTMIKFYGELGTFTMFSTQMAVAQSFNLAMNQIGEVASIEIIGQQSIIRQIRVETERTSVPAPGSAALALAGAGLMARRRRR